MDSRRAPSRQIAAALSRCTLVGAVTVLAVACGLQKPAAVASRGPTGTPVAAAACSPADLKVRIDVRAAGVAAGTSYLPLDFTNVSSGQCRLGGFPVVTLATGGAGRQVGTAGTFDRAQPVHATVLSGGQTAHIWLHVAEVANLPATTCRPVTAAGLVVRLPGQRQATFVSHQVTTCAHRVPGTDILTVEPFLPGPAKPGTAQ